MTSISPYISIRTEANRLRTAFPRAGTMFCSHLLVCFVNMNYIYIFFGVWFGIIAVQAVNTLVITPIASIVAALMAIAATIETAIKYFIISSCIIGYLLFKAISGIWWILCNIYYICTVIFAACCRFYYEPPDIMTNVHSYSTQGIETGLEVLAQVIICVMDFVILVFERVTANVLNYSASLFNTVFLISIVIVVLLILFMFRRYVLLSVVQLQNKLGRIITKRVQGLTINQALIKQAKKEETHVSSSNDSQCVICWERSRNIVLLPCRHLCLCKECSQYLKPDEGEIRCPLCRKVVDIIMPVFA